MWRNSNNLCDSLITNGQINDWLCRRRLADQNRLRCNVWPRSHPILRTKLSQDLTRLQSKQQLRWLRTRKPLAYRESTVWMASRSPYPKDKTVLYWLLRPSIGVRVKTFCGRFIIFDRDPTVQREVYIQKVPVWSIRWPSLKPCQFSSSHDFSSVKNR